MTYKRPTYIEKLLKRSPSFNIQHILAGHNTSSVGIFKKKQQKTVPNSLLSENAREKLFKKFNKKIIFLIFFCSKLSLFPK